MIGVGQALRTAGGFVLLPLALVPLFLVVPRATGDRHPQVNAERAPLDSPQLDLSAAQLRRWRPPPLTPVDSVPVLAYHGVNGRDDHYSVTREAFAEQMEMLDRAGFEAISIAQYGRFLQGDTSDLPKRPLLITFDDGRLDSYRGADKILAEHGFRATMFVIVGRVDGVGGFSLNWGELQRMAQSGRWDIQEHSGVGHVNVVHNAEGKKGPAYANLRYLRGFGLESFAGYKRRVTRDVLWAKRTLSEKIPGFTPWSFAVPYGDYGQEKTNDARIPGFFRSFLLRHFQAVFLTRPPEYTTARSPRGALGRIEVHGDTTADRLYRWLLVRRPSRPPEPTDDSPVIEGAALSQETAPASEAVPQPGVPPQGTAPAPPAPVAPPQAPAPAPAGQGAGG